MGLRSLWVGDIPQAGTRGLLGPLLGIAGGGLLPTGAIHPWPPVPSPLQSVGTWASGTYPVIRATQQAGRGLREGPVEAAAACPAQEAKAGRLGCGVHCLASPLWRAQAQQQPAAGSWQKLRPAPPTQAHPGLHVLAWASSHHGAVRRAGYSCCWPLGGTAWAPGKTLQGEAGFGGLILGLSGTQSTRMGQTGKRAEKRWSTGRVVGQGEPLDAALGSH